ncbi:hypothetical protein KYTH80_01190 [Helicobacter pylori]
MSGLKNFERIKKKRYSYKMRQVLLDNEQEFLFEYEEIRPKKLLNPNDLMMKFSQQLLKSTQKLSPLKLKLLL